MSIQSLGYVQLRSPHLDEWDHFATTVLGLMRAPGPDEASRYYRWDHYPARLMISPADEASVAAIGFEVGDDRDLDVMVAGVEAAGHTVTRGASEEAAQRLVTGFASFTDPAGAPIEMFHGPILDHERLHTPLVSGFITGDMGFGHAVIGVPDMDASIAFYRDVLDFHMRNTWHMGDMSMAFLGCNPRHHSLAFGAGFPAPGLLRHFMIEAATIDDVGMAQDRCVDNDVPVIMGLGRHTNDHMISFYCQSPDGFMVEFGWGGLQVEDVTTTTTYQITKPSFWGHRPILTNRGGA